MKTRTAAGISASTLPRSRMALVGVEALDRQAAAIRIDDLGVAPRGPDHSRSERADERHGEGRDAVRHLDRVRRAPAEVRSAQEAELRTLGVAPVAFDRRPLGV